MNLNEQLGTAFLAVCNAYREAGYTDLHLVGGGESHLRSNEGITPIAPQTSIAVSHLAEVLIGTDKARDLDAGGTQNTTWHGMRLSVVKPSQQARIQVVVRLGDRRALLDPP